MSRSAVPSLLARLWQGVVAVILVIVAGELLAPLLPAVLAIGAAVVLLGLLRARLLR